MHSLISIVMPAYNAELYIRESIESILAQTYQNWELIVVDDCSTDGTASIIKSFPDSRIQYIKNEVNSGVARSRNRAIATAKGMYIAFLDSDDIWQAEKLQKQWDLLEQTRGVISYTATSYMDQTGISFKYVLPAQKKVNYHTLLKKNVMSCSSVMVRTDVMKNISMPGDHMHEDYYTWLTILKAGTYSYGINEPLLKYRISNNSKSANRLKSAKMNFSTYRAIGYTPVISMLLMLRYSVHSISKRAMIKIL